MANALFDKGREAFLNGQINWGTDDIRAILVDIQDYTLNIATHEFLSSVPSAARVAVSAAFTGKSSTNGVADAADITFVGVVGDQSEALIIYKHTGSDATARLIAFLDTATGLPVIPNGGNITVTWDNGTNKIFKL